MSAMITSYGCAAEGRVEPEAVCSVRRGPHLWLIMGDHVHAKAEHGRLRDERCYVCHVVKPCRGTAGENRDRSES
jgi:hypothetical protein